MVDGVRAEPRHDLPGVVFLVRDRPGEVQLHARDPGGVDRHVQALLRRDPARPHGAAAHGDGVGDPLVQLDPVGHHVHARQPVLPGQRVRRGHRGPPVVVGSRPARGVDDGQHLRQRGRRVQDGDHGAGAQQLERRRGEGVVQDGVGVVVEDQRAGPAGGRLAHAGARAARAGALGGQHGDDVARQPGALPRVDGDVVAPAHEVLHGHGRVHLQPALVGRTDGVEHVGEHADAHRRPLPGPGRAERPRAGRQKRD